MTEFEFKRYIKNLTTWMYVSFGIWIFIIVLQLIIGLTTVLFGYGLATLALMVYNIIGVIKYYKNIQIIKTYTKNDAHYLIKYFEGSIVPCWIFMFINLVLGGFVGFFGNMVDLIIAYMVKGDKAKLLMPSNEQIIIED